MIVCYELPVGLTDEFIWPDYPVEALESLNASLAVGLALEPSEGGGPITRFLGYKLLGKPRASRAEAQSVLPLRPGDPSPFFDAFDDITRETGASVSRDYSSPTALATCGPSGRPDWCRVDRLALLAAAGGRAYWPNPAAALQMWFDVTDVLDQPVPETFPARLDENGEPLTWRTWGTIGDNHHPMLVGGRWYRSSAYGQSGQPIEVVEWLPFYLAGGTVLHIEEMQKIQQESQTDPAL